MCTTLANPPHNLPLIVLSIDDLYLPHNEQAALAKVHPNNPLVQHRGQPSTHDVKLGASLFEALSQRKQNIRIPSYDKSAFSGQGDRVDPSQWAVTNAGEKPIEVVLFEGWCVGFRALPDDQLEMKWGKAKEAAAKPGYEGQLGKLAFENVKFVNDKLKEYDVMTL